MRQKFEIARKNKNKPANISRFYNIINIFWVFEACVKNPKNIQKSVRFRFSTGTKSSKTAQNNFSKNRQDVFSTRYQP